MLKKNKLIGFISSIFISLIILYLIYDEVNVGFVESLKYVNSTSLFLVLTIYLIVKYINLIRFKSLFNINKNLLLFNILLSSNLMLNLLPFRVGESSYVYQLKKYYNIPINKSAPKLFLLRFLDYIVIVALFLTSSLFVTLSSNNKLVTLISLVSIGLLTLCFFVFWFIIKINIKISNNKLKKILYVIKEGAISIKEHKVKNILLIFMLTIGYWIIRILMSYVVFLIFDINISFFYLVFVSLALMIIGMLPIKTFGGFGIFEGTWVYYLSLLGYKSSDVLPKILSYHIIILIPVIVYGAASIIYLKLFIKNEDKR